MGGWGLLFQLLNCLGGEVPDDEFSPSDSSKGREALRGLQVKLIDRSCIALTVANAVSAVL